MVQQNDVNKVDLDLESDFEDDVDKLKQESLNEIFGDDSQYRSTEDGVARMYKIGYPTEFIKEYYNVSTGTLYGILSRKSIDTRNVLKKPKSYTRINEMSKQEKDKLVEEYKEGIPLAQIYKRFNINKHGTYKILDSYGVERHRDMYPDRQKEPETNKQDNGQTHNFSMDDKSESVQVFVPRTILRTTNSIVISIVDE